MKFTDLKVGDIAVITKAEPDCNMCRRLMELGLVPGTKVEIIKVAPFGDPVEIRFRGGEFCLRKEEMHCFTFEKFSS